MSVLITEGTYKNALAIMRTLGVKGIEVFASSHTNKAVCFYSKFCKNHFIYPSPHHAPKKYLETIKAIVRKYNIDVFMPVGVASFALASKYKEELTPYTEVPVPDYENFSKAHDKSTVNKMAENLGIPVPKSYTPESIDELRNCIKELGLPVVIKARKGSGIFDFVYTTDEAIKVWKRYSKQAKDKEFTSIVDYNYPVVQEFLPGEIVDVLFVYNQGNVRGCLTQVRHLTLPPIGGVGALNITTKDQEAAKFGIKLMNELKWHGVAMAEFKRDKNGIPKLIEINPKFWGTTEVSISAGMDFPYMLYKIATEGDVKPNFRYLYPKSFGWPIEMGIEHILQSDRSFQAIKDYLKLFATNNSTDIRLLQDPQPFSFQCYKTLMHFYSKLIRSLKQRKIKKMNNFQNKNIK